jgi:hypothetical protein
MGPRLWIGSKKRANHPRYPRNCAESAVRLGVVHAGPWYKRVGLVRMMRISNIRTSGNGSFFGRPSARGACQSP